MLTVSDLLAVDVQGKTEPFKRLGRSSQLGVNPINNDMLQTTGNDIFVRSNVAAMLDCASRELQQIIPDTQLEVVYGYRTLAIQKRLYAAVLAKEKETALTESQAIEQAHQKIAVPSIAGHPTGGAVDLQICRDGVPLDMGTKIWEFTKDSFVFSPYISATAAANRQVLRKVMTNAGFAPFDGEWWHFSYGDREWAAYYKQPCAIYEQVDFRLNQDGILEK